MKRKLTRIIQKRGRWHIAYVKEVPGVNTQGRTVAEARGNVKEALKLALEANRGLATKQGWHGALREPVTVSV